MKLKYYRQILEKFLDVEFDENPPMGAELFHADGQRERERDRQTDRQNDRYDKTNSCLSQFCERA
jgi:hypothetical protein